MLFQGTIWLIFQVLRVPHLLVKSIKLYCYSIKNSGRYFVLIESEIWISYNIHVLEIILFKTGYTTVPSKFSTILICRFHKSRQEASLILLVGSCWPLAVWYQWFCNSVLIVSKIISLAGSCELKDNFKPLFKALNLSFQIYMIIIFKIDTFED